MPKKSVEQQDIQALHRARQRLVNHRTALVSQMRGLLLDRGIAFAKSITRVRRMIPEILARADSGLSTMARETIAELWDFFCDLERRIEHFDKKIEAVFKSSEPCQRVARIKGVGPKRVVLLKKLQIETVTDALLFLPFRYDDRSQVKKIANL
ncbi:MAG: hypothetical protein CL820_07330, partial [Croceicoccus sp.]|nr:hypothetical protein [Croceicoccus sp.]